MSYAPLVLCAVDFSPSSAGILRHAAAFAAGARPDGDGRASLTLLHVVEPRGPGRAMTNRTRRGSGEGRSAAALASSMPSRRAAAGVGLGRPRRPPHARSWTPRAPRHLIVIGTQGHTGAARLFFGSTKQRVRASGTPTLAVRPRPSAIVREGRRGLCSHRPRDAGVDSATPGRNRRPPPTRLADPRRLTLAHVVTEARGLEPRSRA